MISCSIPSYTSISLLFSWPSSSIKKPTTSSYCNTSFHHEVATEHHATTILTTTESHDDVKDAPKTIPWERHLSAADGTTRTIEKRNTSYRQIHDTYNDVAIDDFSFHAQRQAGYTHKTSKCNFRFFPTCWVTWSVDAKTLSRVASAITWICLSHDWTSMLTISQIHQCQPWYPPDGVYRCFDVKKQIPTLDLPGINAVKFRLNVDPAPELRGLNEINIWLNVKSQVEIDRRITLKRQHQLPRHSPVWTRWNFQNT